MQVIDPEGQSIGVFDIAKAQWLAEQLGLDLVEVSPDAKPVVCKLMDYGKYRYEQSKHGKSTVVKHKELQFNVRIGDADCQRKISHAVRILERGDTVDVRVILRGRERSHPELAQALLERIGDALSSAGTCEYGPDGSYTLKVRPLR